MRLVIQRVRSAGVTVAGECVADIGCGLMVLVGVEAGDTVRDASWCAGKIAHIRIFEDEAGKMNLAMGDVGGEALLVSQFTLLGDAAASRRPGFTRAARPEEAQPLFDLCVGELRGMGIPVQTGVFGADMLVSLVNDGPVTLLLDSRRDG